MGLNRAALIAKRIEEEIHIYRKLLDAIDDTVRDALRELSERTGDLDEDEQRFDRLMDVISDEAWKVEDRISPALYRGVLLSLYADTEDSLLALCRGYATARSEAEVENMNCWGIAEAKAFLKNEVGVAVPDQSGAWQELMEFKRLRDCLAHRNGALSDNEKCGSLGRYVARRPDLRVGRHDKVTIDREYVECVLEAATEFFGSLQGKLPTFK